MTLQQICADVKKVKSWGQQAYLGSSHKISFLGKPATGNAALKCKTWKNKLCYNVQMFWFWLKCPFISQAHVPPAGSNPEVRDHEGNRKQTHIPSYQQINCVDNIVRCVWGTIMSVFNLFGLFHAKAANSCHTIHVWLCVGLCLCVPDIWRAVLVQPWRGKVTHIPWPPHLPRLLPQKMTSLLEPLTQLRPAQMV